MRERQTDRKTKTETERDTERDRESRENACKARDEKIEGK